MKEAVYTRADVALTFENDPLEFAVFVGHRSMSLNWKPVTSSLNVKVYVTVWPARIVEPPVRVIVSEG